MYNRFEWMKLVIVELIAILKHPVNSKLLICLKVYFCVWGSVYFLFFLDKKKKQKKSRQKQWLRPFCRLPHYRNNDRPVIGMSTQFCWSRNILKQIPF
jgi:hypothetical protein